LETIISLLRSMGNLTATDGPTQSSVLLLYRICGFDFVSKDLNIGHLNILNHSIQPK